MLGTLYKVKVNRLENLNTIKEEKSKISFTTISNVNLDNVRDSGYYLSPTWGNDITGLPSDLNGNNDKAFYLQVFSLSSTYCQQVLYSFKGFIFYRNITGVNGNFTPWKRIILS